MPATSHMGKKLFEHYKSATAHQSPLSYELRDKPYSKFKPGQTQLDRDYYSKASKEQVSGERNLENYHRFKSDYGKNTSEGTKVGDYTVPSQDANLLCKSNSFCYITVNNIVDYDLGNDPNLYAYTRRAQYDAAKSGNFTNTLGNAGRHALSNASGHWQSQSHRATDEVMALPANPSTRPIWSYPRAAYSSKRSFHHTEYGRTLGTYGHNPRGALPADAENHANVNDQLSIGTTKVTKHIPGYNGFLPKADFNGHALGQSGLDVGRETILK